MVAQSRRTTIYYDEDNASLSFIATDGYELSHWLDESGTTIGSTNPLILNVRESKNLTALAKISLSTPYWFTLLKVVLFHLTTKSTTLGEPSLLQLLPKTLGILSLGKQSRFKRFSTN